MLVSGLWHGAGYTFILWGALHGLACCIHKAFGGYFARLGRGLNIVCTFIIVTLFWVLFRADSIGNALDIYKGLFAFQNGLFQPYTWSFVSIAIMIGASMLAWRRGKSNENALRNGAISGFYPILDFRKFWSKVAFLTFAGLSLLLSYFGNTAFIYGAF